MTARRRPHDGKITGAHMIRDTPCGKAGYRGRKLALQVAGEQRRLTGELIEAYRCPHGCHLWHLGHPFGTRGDLAGRDQWEAS